MTTSRTVSEILVIGAARTRDVVGMAGIAGLMLVAAAMFLLGLAWYQHKVEMAVPAPRVSSAVIEAPRSDSHAHQRQLVLPAASDVPLLLSRIEHAAVDHGLGWPKADYSVNAASNGAPANLEVRCTLKGPYLSLRKFVMTLLQDQPTLTLREFSVTRPNIDSPDVEAKVAIVIYVSDSAAPALERLQ